MKPIDFQFYPFAEAIVPSAVQKYGQDKAVLIFPTESNKRLAVQVLQKSWDFANVQLLTMDEFKERVFYVDRPLLKEEKRTIAFYLSLSDQDRAYFKINNYFQSIELARNFFDLWEEFDEERVGDPVDLDFFLANGIDLSAWQIETFARLQHIRKQYRDFLQKRGFIDQIFVAIPEYFHPAELAEYDTFVFVNQFYYSRLEKWIIDQFAILDKQIHVLYQLPSALVARDQLDVNPFSLRDLLTGQTLPSLQIVCADESFSMLTAFLQQLNQENVHTAVDVDFWNKPYASYLSAEAFKLNSTVPFSRTSIYRILTQFHRLMQALIYDGHRVLVPMNALMAALVADDFFLYICRSVGIKECATLQERCLQVVMQKLDDLFRAVELAPPIAQDLGIDDPDVSRWLQGFYRTVNALRDISTIAALVDLIDKKDGIKVHWMIRPGDLWTTDALETFYRMLSDFSAIETFPLVDSWVDFFAAGSRPAAAAAEVLRLFLDYMKAKQVHLSENKPAKAVVRMTDFLDTRNMSYPSVAVLNLVEGSLPHSRRIPFLFTEPQRKLLHLKTYEEIKLREKYYFYRLLLSSPRVLLFTCANQEQDIEMSSFLEEILLEFPAAENNFFHQRESCYKAVHSEISRPRVARARYRPPDNPEYFRLRYQNDFPAQEIQLTYTKFKQLKNNSMVYYLQVVCGLQELPVQAEEDYSSRLIGMIVHDAMNLVWRNVLRDQQNKPVVLRQADLSAAQWHKALQTVLDSSDYDLKVPHNYTDVYFAEIVLPIVAENCSRFVDHLTGKWGERPVMIYPEAEWEKRQFKEILSATENALECRVCIHGRADLRLEEVNGNEFYIVDYKTGAYDADQLNWYESYYYLLEHPEWSERVDSIFVVLTENSDRPVIKSNRRQGLRSGPQVIKLRLQEILQHIAQDGFTVPAQKTQARIWQEVTRADLYTPNLRRQGKNSIDGDEDVE